MTNPQIQAAWTTLFSNLATTYPALNLDANTCNTFSTEFVAFIMSAVTSNDAHTALTSGDQGKIATAFIAQLATVGVSSSSTDPLARATVYYLGQVAAGQVGGAATPPANVDSPTVTNVGNCLTAINQAMAGASSPPPIPYWVGAADNSPALPPS